MLRGREANGLEDMAEKKTEQMGSVGNWGERCTLRIVDSHEEGRPETEFWIWKVGDSCPYKWILFRCEVTMGSLGLKKKRVKKV